jgi:hypothetical protein
VWVPASALARQASAPRRVAWYVLRPTSFVLWYLFSAATRPWPYKPIQWFEVREKLGHRLLQGDP